LTIFGRSLKICRRRVRLNSRTLGKQKEAQNPRLANADKDYTDGLYQAISILGKLTGRDEQAKKLQAF
jgi:iron complex transport system substrate-binding protein